MLVWGGAWLAGDRTRLRRERMAELEERALRAEREAERERRLAAAEERTRIARDLHDSAGHAINVILVHAGPGTAADRARPPAAREAFETIEEVARETVGEIDQMVRALREDGSDAEGVEPPPGSRRSTGWSSATAPPGSTSRLASTATVDALPAAVDRGAYRILQEALTNAARHGDGSARVEVVFGERRRSSSPSRTRSPPPARARRRRRARDRRDARARGAARRQPGGRPARRALRGACPAARSRGTGA